MSLTWLVPAIVLAGVAGGLAARAAVTRYSASSQGSPCPAAARGRPQLPPLSVEAATAAVIGLLAFSAGPVAVLPAVCWLGACAVPLVLIDVRERRLPNVLTAAAYAGTLVLLSGAAAAGGHWSQLGRAVAGGAVLAAFFLALALAAPGAVGLGDVKLSASAGTGLAWFGWPVLLAGVFAGLIAAAVFGLALLALRRATLRQQIPFAPFLLGGALAAVLAALAHISHLAIPVISAAAISRDVTSGATPPGQGAGMQRTLCERRPWG